MTTLTKRVASKEPSGNNLNADLFACDANVESNSGHYQNYNSLYTYAATIADIDQKGSAENGLPVTLNGTPQHPSEVPPAKKRTKLLSKMSVMD